MPNNLTTITPFLTVSNGIKAVDFYKSAFNASEVASFNMADNKIMAKIEIEGAEFWIGDEEPEFGNLSPDSIHGSPVRIILTTKNADELFESAIRCGAEQICPMTTEEEWRIGKLKDPSGHIWEIGHPL